MTIYSLAILLSQFGTSLLFHVQFWLLPLVLHTGFSEGKMVWYSHLFKNFSQFVVINTVKGFSIVNEAEVGVFLEFPCFLYDPMSVGNLISGSSAFSKPSLYLWKFSVHILLKPSLKDFEHNLASMWHEHNCMVVWTFFGIAFDWIGMKTDFFQYPNSDGTLNCIP